MLKPLFRRFALHIASLFLVAASIPDSESATYEIKTIASPSDGGTIAGGGTFNQGTFVPLTLEAIPTWYIWKIAVDGQYNIDSFQSAFGAAQLIQGPQVKFLGSIQVSRDKEVVVYFAPKAPKVQGFVTNQGVPTDKVVLGPDNLSLGVVVSGIGFPTYQWYRNGAAIAGATDGGIFFSPPKYEDRGIYTVRITNSFGSTESAPIEVVFPTHVKAFRRQGSDLQEITGALSFAGEAMVELQSNIPGSLIFYTLDGTEPGFSSSVYVGPLALTQSGTLRAKAYSADFSDSVALAPIPISVGAPLSIDIPLSSFGRISLSKPGPYAPNETVEITATPWQSHHRFLTWIGSLASTNPTINVSVKSNLFLYPIYGAEVRTVPLGGGTILGASNTTLVPLSASLRLTAVPNPGFAFVRWGGNASGTDATIEIPSILTNLLVTALFEALPQGRHAVSAVASGRGSVAVEPRENHVEAGTAVQFRAVPEAGQTFLGWEGVENTLQNPLIVTLQQSTTITGRFSTNIVLAARKAGNRLELSIPKSDRDIALEETQDFVAWDSIVRVPALSGGTIIPLPILATNRFFRAVRD